LNSGQSVPNALGWSRLPYDPSLIGIKFINNLLVREQHTPATIPIHIEIVEDLLGILASISPALVLLVCSGDYFTTRETANRYHIVAPLMYAVFVINLTGMISGISSVHRDREVSSILSDVSH